MKHAKKSLSMLLCILLLLSLMACGGTETPDFESEQVEADVQEYLETFVDESAKIVSLHQTRNNISKTQVEVSCEVAYSTGGNGNCVMTLLYEKDDAGWNLNQCDTDFDESDAGSAR